MTKPAQTLEPSSSAIRVARAFRTLGTKRGSGKDLVTAWSELLELSPELDIQQRIPLVALAMIALQEEIDATRALADLHQVPRKLWDAPLNRARRSIPIANLSMTLDQAMADFADSQTSLEWLAEMLPPTEYSINQEDIEALFKQLNELEAAVQRSGLPPDVKVALFEQMDAIRKSLREYPIRGAKAVRKALYQTAAAWNVEPIVSEHADAPEVGAFTKLVEKVWKLTDIALRIEKVLTAGTKLTQLANAAIDHFRQLPPAQ